MSLTQKNPQGSASTGKISALALPLAVVTGSACALFLWLLELATGAFQDRPALLYLLPLAGLVVVLAYHRFGKGSEHGNNLLMDEIHEPGLGVPRRMGPFILLSTVFTHLFGGSAGREGTAVQMGGSLAEAWSRILGFGHEDRRTLLMAGMAAGFAAVFGTPLAGALFAMEVLVFGRIQWAAWLPCLIAAFVAHGACLFWGTAHRVYHVSPFPLSALLPFKVLLASAAFGLAAWAFIKLSHAMSAWFKEKVRPYWARPLLAGGLVVALVAALGTREYLGLGLDGITLAFREGLTPVLAWAWKMLFTALTLAGGFKGGEVTPLFFIGATLGNILSSLLQAPVELLAGLGLVAVFAAATNTPLACAVMGAELFGWQLLPWLLLACYGARLCSGKSSIYPSQRRS